MNERHYHIWLYERDTDGTINVLRRQPDTFLKRRQAIYALQRFRFWPGQGTTYTPGQVLACDDGAFCEPHRELIEGITMAGPAVIPATEIIDGQTKSLRPAVKEVVGKQVIQRMVDAGDATYVKTPGEPE